MGPIISRPFPEQSMTTPRQTTLTRFLIEEQRRSEETCPAELRLLIETVARAPARR